MNSDIARAEKILELMSSSKRGAEGLRGADGREEMIDRPMVLQVGRSPPIVNGHADAALAIAGRENDEGGRSSG
jgi:hypothetical protein